ncbi:uncharacterized protein LOC130678494 [Microplitis mediator]|uniref:uncharacterized protein LOC130678494 n=1 Tax=Microplitis mediator TaxID=375433 RepID=UPI002556346B|nr:uncharacterized protein LOC130678494 [Microplitis mediator]
MASDIWRWRSSDASRTSIVSFSLKKIILWRFIVLMCYSYFFLPDTVMAFDINIHHAPSEEFSSYKSVKPRIFHGRSKREIFDTRENEHKHADILTVGFEVDGVERILDLRLNTDLIPVGFKQRRQHNGGYKTEVPDKHEICHYQGSVRGIPDSWVAVSTCHGFKGVIFDGENMHHIHPEYETINSNHYLYKHTDLLNNYTCGYKGSHDATAHLNLRRKRATEIVRGPYNANRQSRYVELVLVIDKKEFTALGENIDKVHHHCKDIANIINALYTPLNIFVALVGVEVWTESDEITLSSKGDTTLANFLRYRREMLVKEIPNDNAQLLTRINFEDGVVGKALKGPICTYEFSGGVSIDHSNIIGIVAATVAHEMGHNFGMEHDNADCDCPEDRCIMAASSGSTSPIHWSSCSLEYLALAFEHGMDYCLRNKPLKLFDSPICGNGFVEPGEQCDCGLKENCDNPCCNATTCMLYSNASCATGECCDLKTCKPKNAGVECRDAEHECDLAEYCTGQSEYCPKDVFKIDGESCNMGKAFCYQGSCRTHNDQCKLLWGPSGSSSDSQCYNMNNKGTKLGNCGYNRLNSSYIKCDDPNILCGMLHCKHLNERLEFGMESVAILSHSFINNGGKIIACRSAMVDLGLNQVDPGLSPDGAKCAPGKMCVNQKCMPIADLRTLTIGRDICPNNCGGNGVCNSLGHCHCNRGFRPPDCVQPGYGGSDDSGPAEDPNARSDFVTVLYIVFLGIVPTISFISIGVWYRKNNSSRPGWKKDMLSPNDRGFGIKTIDRPHHQYHPHPHHHHPLSGIETIDSTLSADPACASLLPKSGDEDERFSNNLFGHFKGFTLKPLADDLSTESSTVIPITSLITIGPSTKPPGPSTKPPGPSAKPPGPSVPSTNQPGPSTKPPGPSAKPPGPSAKPPGPSVPSTNQPGPSTLPPSQPVLSSLPPGSSTLPPGTSITQPGHHPKHEPTKPAPAPPTVTLKPTIRPLRSAFTSQPLSSQSAPALPPLNPGSTARPLISSPVLAATTCTSMDLPVPSRPAPEVPIRPPETLNNSSTSLTSSSTVPALSSIPASLTPNPTEDRPKSSTLNRIASILRPQVPKSSRHQKAIKVDKEILRNLEISNPIPQQNIQITGSSLPISVDSVDSPDSRSSEVKIIRPPETNSKQEDKKVVMRAQSMRDSKQPRPAIHSFGSMRSSVSIFKRPSSIPNNRPTSPPPPVPTQQEPLNLELKIPGLPGYQTPITQINLTKQTDYDDCMNLIGHNNKSCDNIYAVIEEVDDKTYKVPKPVDNGLGLLGEIVSEISNRNFDSIYSTSTLKRNKNKHLNDVNYVNSGANDNANHYKSPASIYSNSSTTMSAVLSETSSGYLLPSAVNVPRLGQNKDAGREREEAEPGPGPGSGPSPGPGPGSVDKVGIDINDKLNRLESSNPNVNDSMSKALGLKPPSPAKPTVGKKDNKGDDKKVRNPPKDRSPKKKIGRQDSGGSLKGKESGGGSCEVISPDVVTSCSSGKNTEPDVLSGGSLAGKGNFRSLAGSGRNLGGNGENSGVLGTSGKKEGNLGSNGGNSGILGNNGGNSGVNSEINRNSGGKEGNIVSNEKKSDGTKGNSGSGGNLDSSPAKVNSEDKLKTVVPTKGKVIIRPSSIVAKAATFVERKKSPTSGKLASPVSNSGVNKNINTSTGSINSGISKGLGISGVNSKGYGVSGSSGGNGASGNSGSGGKESNKIDNKNLIKKAANSKTNVASLQQKFEPKFININSSCKNNKKFGNSSGGGK